MQYLIPVSVPAHMAKPCDAETKMFLLNKVIAISVKAHIAKQCDAGAKMAISLNKLISVGAAQS